MYTPSNHTVPEIKKNFPLSNKTKHAVQNPSFFSPPLRTIFLKKWGSASSFPHPLPATLFSFLKKKRKLLRRGKGRGKEKKRKEKKGRGRFWGMQKALLACLPVYHWSWLWLWLWPWLSTCAYSLQRYSTSNLSVLLCIQYLSALSIFPLFSTGFALLLFFFTFRCHTDWCNAYLYNVYKYTITCIYGFANYVWLRYSRSCTLPT
jgi:hypothetical protein